MNNILAIFQKQVKDTLKNKTILIQFVMFPVMTLIMENAINLEGMPEHFFGNLFATMYLGMAPLTAMAAIIAEEKEKNTLRVLLMSNVKPFEFLVGVGLYIWLICMAGASVIGLGSGYRGEMLGQFLLPMCIGILVSLLMGAAIGTWSKNQMMATSVTVPVMLVFSFLPMLSMFNEGIGKVARFAYSQQISLWVNQLGAVEELVEKLVVIGINMAVAVILFVVAYKKSGLE